MAETLTIRERIELRLVELLSVIPGVVRVERWNDRGNKRDHLVIIVVPEDQTTIEGADGRPGTSINTLRVAILVCIAAQESDPVGAILHNRWAGNVIFALMAEDAINEPVGGEAIAYEIRATGVENEPTENDQPEFYTVVNFEIDYNTNRDSPYIGPVVTAKVV